MLQWLTSVLMQGYRKWIWMNQLELTHLTNMRDFRKENRLLQIFEGLVQKFLSMRA